MVALFVIVGAGSWWVGRETSSEARSVPDAPDASATVVTSPTVPTTTTTRQLPGARLAAGPATLFVVGDSIMLGARAQVESALAGWDVTMDARVGRGIDEGIDIVTARRSPAARVLAVHLCTNWAGSDYRDRAERLLAAVPGVERVVWFTCTPWRSEVRAADDVIRTLPDTHPQVVVADWGVVSGGTGYIAGDGIHLNAPGVTALAALTAAVVGPPPPPA